MYAIIKKGDIMAKFKDLTGCKFTKLTVIKLARKEKKGNRYRYYWQCRCECGNLKEVRTDCLTQGMVQSCGCLKKEQDKINLVKNHKHKLSHTKLWDTYYSMKSRCYNQNDKRYNDYGGRGIKICNEWLQSFDNFVQWAVLNGFKKELQIDRIDNNLDYSPKNCRWVSAKENCRNRRSNILIEYNNKWITLVEFAEILNIPYKTAYNRYRKKCIKREDL